MACDFRGLHNAPLFQGATIGTLPARLRPDNQNRQREEVLTVLRD
jgi:hypothetical protein